MRVSLLPPRAAAVIRAEGLTRTYGERTALDGLSVTIPEGSVFGLLGPNGSGKSTFLMQVAAMEPAPAGLLEVFGEAPRAALRQRVGTVFQEAAHDPLMPAQEHLDLAGRLFGVPASARREATARLLYAFGLSDRARDRVATLSGGMRRRLDVARALVHDPELLLLDEPTTGIDPGERRALWSALLANRGRRSVVLATNDLAEAEDVCEAVAFIRAGRVVASGTPAGLRRGLAGESVRLDWPGHSEAALAEIAGWPGIGSVASEGPTVLVTVDDGGAFVPRVFSLAPHDIRAVTIQRTTLQDAYFHHVGHRAVPDLEAVG